MTELPIYQIDAFTGELFRGNPAAVVPLESWLDDATLGAVAAENNLSETAFFVRAGDAFELRWFTPTVEVELCGHATLASAFVLFEELGFAGDTIRFATASGRVAVTRAADLLSLDFPRWGLERVASPPARLLEALAGVPDDVLRAEGGDKYLVVYADEASVAALAPDFGRLAELHPACVIVTAPGSASDCVCRYFAPSYGIPEDPVTGSIHCALAPYWADRLGRSEIHSRQLSRRGGELFCRVGDDRTMIAGRCVKYLEGRIRVP